MLGMASQLAEREDAVLCSDVRDKLFGPNEFSRRDLGALNIMRGRDNGLSDYNTVPSRRNLTTKLNAIKSANNRSWRFLDQNVFRTSPGREIRRHQRRIVRASSSISGKVREGLRQRRQR